MELLLPADFSMTLPATLLQDFHFLRPWWLLALIPALGFVIALWRLNAAATAWDKAIDKSLLPYLLDRNTNVAGRQPAFLLISAWLFATLALAGPAWEKLPQPVQQREDALVIVMDLSLSMFAPDHQPSRLDLAKRKLRDILALRDEGQTALVVYAGDAHIVTPLTDDVVTIAALVPPLSPNIMPLFGSNPEAGIDLALGLLDDMETARGKILLMTDGIRGFEEEQRLVEQMSGTGYRLLVMGIGTEEGAPIRTSDGGMLMDEQGQVVVPTLNRNVLQSLANRAGGRYHDIQLSDSDLAYLLADFDLFDDEQLLTVDDEEFDVWYEVGPWLLLLVLPLSALGFRRGWLFSMALPMLAGLLTMSLLLQPQPLLAAPQTPQTPGGQPSVILTPNQAEQLPLDPAAAPTRPGWRWRDLWQTRDQQGDAAFATEQYATAASLFNSPEWQGAAAYRSEDYEAAVVSYSTSDNTSTNYNRGNALAHAGNYAEAISAYQRTLELEPEHADALHNLAIVEQLLEQQEQQQNENQDGENQEEQSEQNSDEQAEQQEESENQDEQSEEGNEEQDQQEQQNESPDEQEASESNSEQNTPTDNSNEEFEEQQSLEQWLRRIEDDPGELLSRKFRYQYRQRQLEGTANNTNSGGQIW
ncbi:MAG: VWA domain-containing protein [Pseudohongiellaceae bacterium]